MVITKEEGLKLFADNPFKVALISTKVPDNSRTTVYKCGDLIDLCRGPHVAHTGKVKAFAATRHSACSWLGDTKNDALQRMYGISFPDKKMLKVWKINQEKVSWLSMISCRRIQRQTRKTRAARANRIWNIALCPIEPIPVDICEHYVKRFVFVENICFSFEEV